MTSDLKIHEDKNTYCTFCGKHQGEVFLIIMRPPGFICDECIDLCQTILTGKRIKAANKQKGQDK